MSTFPYHVRAEVQAFDPYTPGLSIDEIRARFGLATVVKMASNENPLGTPPLAQRVIRDRADAVFRYTRSDTPGLVRALADFHGAAPEHIVVGNGSDEIIDLLIRVCPTPGKHSVVAFRPSFSMYGVQSRFCGVEFRQTPLRRDFSFDWQGLRDCVDADTALVFITTPDNPSGYCPPIEEVAAFARDLPCLLVIDEAYMDFCGNEAEHSLLSRRESFPNIIFLRTFSKSFGLAGLRLGYGIMPKALADILHRVRSPFSVNLLAEEAGMAALADTAFRAASLAVVIEGRAWLTDQLAGLGCRVYPSLANFIMFQLPEGASLSAREAFEALLSRGLIIRPLSSYNLPDHLRVSVGTMEENRLFITLLRDVLAS